MATREQLLDAALRYAAYGWPVFPVLVGVKKEPATPHGFKDASTDPEQIRAWWAAVPYLIAVACGPEAGVFVVDVDPHNGGAWQCPVPTLTARSGGRYPGFDNGTHYFFKWPAGVAKMRPTLSTGVDVKGAGGYIILAPSTTDAEYQWVDTREPADAPPELLAEIAIAEGATTGERPGDKFNETHTIAEILEPLGWRIDHEQNGETYWTRPGKDEGVSATENYANSGLFYVFSTSTGLEVERGYDAFGLYAALYHDGDISAAAAALAEQTGTVRPTLTGAPVATTTAGTTNGALATSAPAAVTLRGSGRRADYQFTPAVHTDHIIDQFTRLMYSVTDAPLEYAEAAALSMLSVMTSGMRVSLAHVPGGVRTNLYLCVNPETRILTADLRWVNAETVRAGDVLVGFDEEQQRGQGNMRALRPAVVEAVAEHEASYRYTLTAGGRSVTCSPDHRWLVTTESGKPRWRTAVWLATHREQPHYIDTVFLPWDEAPRDDSWLGGIIDGEGSLGVNGALQIAQKPGPVADRIRIELTTLGVPFHEAVQGSSGVLAFSVYNRSDIAKVLGVCRTLRLPYHYWDGRHMNQHTKTRALIDSVKLAPAGRVVSIQTSTSTFIAEGFPSHNCLLGTSSVSRKSTVQGYANAMLAQIRPNAVLPDRMTTESAINELGQRTVALWTPDEMGLALQQVYRTGSYSAGFEELLLTLYSGQAYRYTTVTGGERLIDGIDLSVLGAATPESLGAISGRAIGTGLLPRFGIVYPLTLPPERDPIAETAAHIAARQYLVGRFSRIYEACSTAGVNHNVTISQPALTVLGGLGQEMGKWAMTTRLVMAAYKVAALIALGDLRLEVSSEDAVSAVAIVRRWADGARALRRFLGRSTTDEAFMAQVESAREELRALVRGTDRGSDGRTGMEQRLVARALAVPFPTLKRIRDTMESTGEVVIVTSSTGDEWRLAL